MQAATEKIRDVPAGAECHVAQFGYDEAQTQTRSTGRVRGEALRYGHVSERMKEDSAARMQGYFENLKKA